MRPEGRCHVVNGGTDCAFSQGIERSVREAGLSHRLGEGAEDDCSAPWFVKALEEWVVVVFEFVEETFPSDPRSIPLVLCLTCRALFTGRLTSNEETHDTIFDGRTTILKLSGICDGIFCLRRRIRFRFDMCKSRDKESETSLSSPGNHYEYKHTRASWMRMAR